MLRFAREKSRAGQTSFHQLDLCDDLPNGAPECDFGFVAYTRCSSQLRPVSVDTSDVTRIGEGSRVAYAYGYRCCEDRLKADPPRVSQPGSGQPAPRW